MSDGVPLGMEEEVGSKREKEEGRDGPPVNSLTGGNFIPNKYCTKSFLICIILTFLSAQKSSSNKKFQTPLLLTVKYSNYFRLFVYLFIIINVKY